MNIQKNINTIGIGVFLLFLSLPAVFGIILPKRTNALIENRRLADVPQLPTSWQEFKSLPSKFDAYYADHFGFRWSLLFVYRHLKFYIHDTSINTALFGNEKGWIFYNNKKDGDSINDFRNINRFSKRQMNLFIERIKQKQQWLAQRNIEYLFVIAPSKQYIYPEYLPEYIKPTVDRNLIEQLSLEMQKHPEIHFLNLTPAIRHAKSNKLLYYKADSHWYYFGANIAQYEIAKKLLAIFPQQIYPSLHPDSLFKKHKFYGELARYMGLEKYFEEENYVPQLAECATDTQPKNRVFKQSFSTHCESGNLSAIVFRDSFFTILQPFMSLYFKDVEYIWQKMTFVTAEKALQRNKPDIMIEEWVDRYLPKSLPPTYVYKKK
jgi:hypothetical protein